MFRGRIIQLQILCQEQLQDADADVQAYCTATSRFTTRGHPLWNARCYTLLLLVALDQLYLPLFWRHHKIHGLFHPSVRTRKTHHYQISMEQLTKADRNQVMHCLSSLKIQTHLLKSSVFPSLVSTISMWGHWHLPMGSLICSL